MTYEDAQAQSGAICFFYRNDCPDILGGVSGCCIIKKAAESPPPFQVDEIMFEKLYCF